MIMMADPMHVNFGKYISNLASLTMTSNNIFFETKCQIYKNCISKFLFHFYESNCGAINGESNAYHTFPLKSFITPTPKEKAKNKY